MWLYALVIAVLACFYYVSNVLAILRILIETPAGGHFFRDWILGVYPTKRRQQYTDCNTNLS